MNELTIADRLVGTLLADPAAAVARHAAQIPELAALQGCPQPRNHHAEGDVAAHTALALAVYADLEAQVEVHAGATLAEAGVAVSFPPRTLTAAVAVLLHDVGKPRTIAGEVGAWTYYGHEKTGAETAARLMARLDLPGAALRAGTVLDTGAVVWLISNHLFWLNTDIRRVTYRAVARRFIDSPHLGELLRVLNWCDVLGSRAPDGRPHVQMLVAAEQRIAWAQAKAAARAAAPEPIIDGEAVMQELGITSGPRVGAVLRLAQRVNDDAVGARQWLQGNADRLRSAPVDELREEARG